jgi:hypothetical protein
VETGGIAMRADPKTGEVAGGLQAPFVFRAAGRFEMFYGGWNDICSASSADGKVFERTLDTAGKVTLFGASTENTRDPMVLRVGDLWHRYYTAHPHNKGAVYSRTSPDLQRWGEERIVAKGGQAGDGPFSAECPFVVESEPGAFYLFRTQRYGQNARTSVYSSRDPLDFGLDHDEGHFLCTLPVAAPEILKHEGTYYIAALLPSLTGIQIARLEWVPRGAGPESRPAKMALGLRAVQVRTNSSGAASSAAVPILPAEVAATTLRSDPGAPCLSEGRWPTRARPAPKPAVDNRRLAGRDCLGPCLAGRCRPKYGQHSTRSGESSPGRTPRRGSR